VSRRSSSGARTHLAFDLARAQLLYGEHLRRERRRVDAPAALREALESFQRLGAEPWLERARTELRASGETARKREHEAPDRLTPQELQVARRVVEEHSNKEVAAQLFLSPRTIDAHLRSVYSKLGISSRTQLARLPLGARLARRYRLAWNAAAAARLLLSTEAKARGRPLLR
jgi:DNA-binding CsgD family transcriptional regulator